MSGSAGGYYRAEDLGALGWAVATRHGASVASDLTERAALMLAKQLNTAYAVGYADAKEDAKRAIDAMRSSVE